MSKDRNAWISARAYAIWEQEGRPSGRDGDHWNRAMLERDRLEQTRASHDGNEILARRANFERMRREAIVLSGASVLVVEDEPAIRYDTVEGLSSAGFKTFEAENADEALQLMKDNSVSTLYTDIHLPGSIDGVGLAAKVQSLWPKTQVIIASGIVRLKKRQLNPGLHFVQKPVPISHLFNLIWKHAG